MDFEIMTRCDHIRKLGTFFLLENFVKISDGSLI